MENAFREMLHPAWGNISGDSLWNWAQRPTPANILPSVAGASPLGTSGRMRLNPRSLRPLCDMIELQNCYILEMEMAGVDKSNIHITFNEDDGLLSISADKNSNYFNNQFNAMMPEAYSQAQPNQEQQQQQQFMMQQGGMQQPTASPQQAYGIPQQQQYSPQQQPYPSDIPQQQLQERQMIPQQTSEISISKVQFQPKFVFQERRFGHLERHFRLPRDARTSTDSIKTSFEHGVLYITFQKTPESSAKRYITVA